MTLAVLLALIPGAILFGAGLLLFVAAAWDEVSPAARLCMVLEILIFSHGLGLLVRERKVEVTVPAIGPTRPIQLAQSDTSGFYPLKMGQTGMTRDCAKHGVAGRLEGVARRQSHA